MTTRSLRCAIYTRKSSEEGLDQDFNSLEAQREACEAYIQTQSHEGWKSPRALRRRRLLRRHRTALPCVGLQTSQPARSTSSSSTRSIA